MTNRPHIPAPGRNITPEELDDLFAEYGRFIPVIALQYCPNARAWVIERFCDGIKEFWQFGRVGASVSHDLPISFAFMLTVHFKKYINFN